MNYAQIHAFLDDCGATSCNAAAAELVEALQSKHQKITTAESCTGGKVGGAITSISGASSVYECGVISYSNRIKNKVLGVPKRILEKYGAVSYQTANDMAKGAMRISGADIAVSVTGVAGAESEGKPTGLVFICARTHEQAWMFELHLNDPSVGEAFKREYIREMSVRVALLAAITASRSLA